MGGICIFLDGGGDILISDAYALLMRFCWAAGTSALYTLWCSNLARCIGAHCAGRSISWLCSRRRGACGHRLIVRCVGLSPASRGRRGVQGKNQYAKFPAVLEPRCRPRTSGILYSLFRRRGAEAASLSFPQDAIDLNTTPVMHHSIPIPHQQAPPPRAARSSFPPAGPLRRRYLCVMSPWYNTIPEAR